MNYSVKGTRQTQLKALNEVHSVRLLLPQNKKMKTPQMTLRTFARQIVALLFSEIGQEILQRGTKNFKMAVLSASARLCFFYHVREKDRGIPFDWSWCSPLKWLGESANLSPTSTVFFLIRPSILLLKVAKSFP